MVTCSRCRNVVDETKQTTCPVCAAPLPVAAPASAAPTYRTTLTGEVIEVSGSNAAPAPPVGVAPPHAGSANPAAPPSPFGAPIPPAPPRPAMPAAYSTAPEMQADERKVIRAGIAIGSVLLLLLVVGVGALYFRYANQQAAFNKATHVHLETPEAAAREMIETLRDENWGRIYWIVEFGDSGVRTVHEAISVGRGFRAGWENAAASSPGKANLETGLKSITDIKIGQPEGKGDHVSVPVTTTMNVAGDVKPRTGVLHLVNCEDGKWRVDLTSISMKHPGPEDAQAFGRMFFEALGMTAASTPATQPAASGGGFTRSSGGFTAVPTDNRAPSAPPYRPAPQDTMPPPPANADNGSAPPANNGESSSGSGQTGAGMSFGNGAPPSQSAAPPNAAPPPASGETAPTPPPQGN